MSKNEEPNASRFALSSHQYQCVWCGATNDSLTAEWCSDVTSTPSLTCGSCGRCFCKATKAWRHAFLTSPAAAAYKERAAKLTKAFRPSVTPDVEDLPRPVILVVDDDKVVHVIAKRVLAEFGGTLLNATDGESAFETAQQVLPDLVITDALIPKLDGRELSKRLKSTPETQDCKVAVMTALYKGLRYSAEAMREFKVDAYVEKPLTPDTLRNLVSELLYPATPRTDEKAAAVGATA